MGTESESVMTQIEKAEATIREIGKETFETCDYMDGLRAYILKQAEMIDTILRAVGPQEFDVPVEYYRGRLDALSAAIDIVDPEP